MLGLGRPRLKARPSLLELITKKNIEELALPSPSDQAWQEFVDDIDDLPPLPTSPALLDSEKLSSPPPLPTKGASRPTTMPSVRDIIPSGASWESIELIPSPGIEERENKARSGRRPIWLNLFRLRVSLMSVHS